MDFRNSWGATWQADGLHVAGTTDLFPNDFSTAQLHLETYDRLAGIRTYRLAFSRDKEPFCGKDLVGPVVHVDRFAPADTRVVRVVSPTGVEVGLCHVRSRAPAT